MILDVLAEQPILLLVVVAALGYLIGKVEVRGSSLGVAAVLFAGLGVGALDPRLKLPEFATLFGLVLFVYGIGLSSGPSFFSSFKRKGLRDNLLVAAVLTGAFGLAFGLYALFDLAPPEVAGLFSGALTNTPALAGLLEYARSLDPAGGAFLDAPVIGYSIAYPVGVVGVILAIAVAQKLWRVDYAAEAAADPDEGADRPLVSRSVRVTRADLDGVPVRELVGRHGWDGIRFGRIRRQPTTQAADGEAPQQLVGAETRFRPGDVVSVVGDEEAAAGVVGFLGEAVEERLETDRSEYDFRRVFVSDPRVTGRPLRSLSVLREYDVIVTRVRRGDVEWLAHGHTVLEPGDRIRVVARPEDLPAISAAFGDSVKALSEINLLTFSLGLAIGLLVGLIPVPLPGGITFRLGLAGGPLVAGLVLGKLGRTGPFVWYLPYSANMLLRQLGLVLFFAGVGTRSGYAFFSTLGGAGGLALFAAGAVLTFATAVTALWVGYKLLKIPMGTLVGLIAGLHTQPAVLSYALDQTGDDRPGIGYATVFPTATILKILYAQLLLALLI